MKNTFLQSALLLLFLSPLASSAQSAPLEEPIVSKFLEVMKKASDAKDAQKSICMKTGVMRGILFANGDNCKNPEVARLFKLGCLDYVGAKGSSCDKNADIVLKGEDIKTIKANVVDSAKIEKSITRKILCVSYLTANYKDKLFSGLRAIASTACATPSKEIPLTAETPKSIYNVLSLDGGGLRGIGTLKMLVEMEKQTGKKASDIFDMFIGTSTGGLISILLSEGWTAENIVKFYVEYGPVIFQKTFSKRLRSVNGVIGTKYTAKELEKVMNDVVDIKMLSDAKKPVAVTSVNANTGELNVISSYDKSGPGSKFTMQDAARATSAAPTYFKGKQVAGDIWIDGGVGANDPAASAFGEAKKIFPKGSRIRIVSLGTGKANEAGLSRDSGIKNVAKIVETFQKAGTESSQRSLIESLANDDSQNLEYYRFQFTLPEKIDLADTRAKTVQILHESGIARANEKDFKELSQKLKDGK